MNAWTEQTQMMIRSRIRERQLEAAGERLAATAGSDARAGFRQSLGRLLILTGRRVAGEPARTAGPAAHPTRPIAA